MGQNSSRIHDSNGDPIRRRRRFRIRPVFARNIGGNGVNNVTNAGVSQDLIPDDLDSTTNIDNLGGDGSSIHSILSHLDIPMPNHPPPPPPPPAPPIDNISQGENSLLEQANMLSRLLEIATISTVITLVGRDGFGLGRRIDNRNTVTQIESERSRGIFSNHQVDITFNEFLSGLHGGLLGSELLGSVHETTDQNMTFFRAFRFDRRDGLASNTSTTASPLQRVINQFNREPTNGSNSSFTFSNIPTGSNGGSSQEATTVPVVIVGVRSVAAAPEEPAARPSSNTDPQEDDTMFNLSPSIFSSGLSHTNANSNSTLSLASNHSHSSASSSNSPDNQRSWIIFVMGNVYPQNHPLLSSPTLLTDNPTYEDLLHLQDLLYPVKSDLIDELDLSKCGEELTCIIDDESDSESFKSCASTHLHSKLIYMNKDDCCPICLLNYTNKETIKRLNCCNHIFHNDCINYWLMKGKNNCPLCRVRVLDDIKKTKKSDPSSIHTSI